MSKKFTFYLNPLAQTKIFKAIRNKQDILIILFESIKYMSLYSSLHSSLHAPQTNSRIEIIIDKMSRLFFYQDDQKCFSLVMPFRVDGNSDQNIQFYSGSLGSYLTSENTSHVISVVAGFNLNQQGAYDFVDEIWGISEDDNFWILIKELFLIEDGYIRFDSDSVRANGHLHPLNHLDIFYSSNVTFKVGLHKTESLECLPDILDVQTNCRYLREPDESWFSRFTSKKK